MANFASGYKAVIVPNEGGYVPLATAISIGDSGGETYKGVSRNNNPSWPGWGIIDKYKAQYGIPKLNYYFVSPALDKMVYDLGYKNYWQINKLDSVNSQAIANLIMDIDYGSGPYIGAISAQRALGITADGDIGTQTLNAINNANQSKLLTDLVAYREQWLKTNQAGKSYLPVLLKRTESYLSGAASLVSNNKSIVIPVLLAGGAVIGLYFYSRRSK